MKAPITFNLLKSEEYCINKEQKAKPSVSLDQKLECYCICWLKTRKGREWSKNRQSTQVNWEADLSGEKCGLCRKAKCSGVGGVNLNGQSARG